MAQVMISVSEKVENIVGNGEALSTTIFYFVSIIFTEAKSIRAVKTCDSIVHIPIIPNLTLKALNKPDGYFDPTISQ